MLLQNRAWESNEKYYYLLDHFGQIKSFFKIYGMSYAQSKFGE